MNLVLHVKGIYFDQIKAGTKVEEYRLGTPYWSKRLFKRYENVVIARGYPKADDTDKHQVFPWNGVTRRSIVHPHFGSRAVDVYVIALTKDHG